MLACQQPRVGERKASAATPTGTSVVLEDAWVDMHGHVVADFVATEEDVPLGLGEVMALAPRFTLARLTDHPADGIRAWESQIATGHQEATQLRPGGPDDPEVLTSVRQPGCEIPDSVLDLGDGRYRYVFQTALGAFDPDETLRVGMWLDATESPSARTSTTFDFRPSGGLMEERDPVLDANCAGCHGAAVMAHERRSGVRLCATCHTWQATDPDTVDPAAIFSTSTTAKTNPNPLELGRMVHRIHRAKDLPTVYASLWNPTGASTVPSSVALPLPFAPTRSGSAIRNLPILGRKYSVIGEDGREVVFAQPLVLQTADPTPLGTMMIVAGGMFPRDLRDCAVCHDGALQAYMVKYAISRRTCSGCHPEIWYRASPPLEDRSRFPHPGGPQTDDTQCAGCHVTGTPRMYAPIAEIHVPPARAPRYNKPVIEIVKVEGLKAGSAPTITFRLYDRVGPIVPTPSAPVPAWEPEGLTTSYVPGFEPGELNTSYVARKLNALSFRIIGPTAPDYAVLSGVDISSGAAGGNPDPLVLSTSSAADEYVYTFSSVIPPGTAGTFAIGTEVRRFATPTFYDRALDVFRWPYTGETVGETAENVIVYVNSESGEWPTPAGRAAPVPRRTVVDLEKCLRCHDRIEFHSGTRHDVAWCITCHTYDNSDVDKRFQYAGRLYPGGPVRIGITYDGIEERSTHFKTMVHRIHTGARKGAASLEAILPYVLYYSKAYFFDRGGFPNDLRNCTLCHSGKSYLVESIPAGAPGTRANEQPTIWHADGQIAHPADEPATPPVQAACLGCHATGATFAHVAAKTVDGVETCANCHSKGPVSVEVAHGLAPLTGGVATSFSAIVAEILVPRCATSACHSGPPPAPAPQLDAASAYQALVNAPSGQSVLPMVKPGAPEESYLLYKLRGDAGAGSGSTLTQMPPAPDSPLDPADLAAIEAWIANGAPND